MSSVSLAWYTDSATTLETGRAISATAGISCTTFEEDSCEDLELFIPFDPEAPAVQGATKIKDYRVSLQSSPRNLLDSSEAIVTDTGWSIPLARSLNGGEQATVVFTVTPPSVRTPNGTTIPLAAEIRSSNATTTTVAPLEFTVTAESAGSPSFDSDRYALNMASGGTQQTNFTSWDRRSTQYGMLGSATGDAKLVLSVPAPLEVVTTGAENDPVWDPAARTATWNSVPYPDSQTHFTLRVPSGIAKQQVQLKGDLTYVPLGNEPGDSVTASVSMPVNIVDGVEAWQASSLFTSANSLGWGQPVMVPEWKNPVRPAAFETMIVHTQLDMPDLRTWTAMPCLDNRINESYETRFEAVSEPGSLCARPAFDVTSLKFKTSDWASNGEIVTGTVTLHYVDGTTDSFEVQGGAGAEEFFPAAGKAVTAVEMLSDMPNAYDDSSASLMIYGYPSDQVPGGQYGSEPGGAVILEPSLFTSGPNLKGSDTQTNRALVATNMHHASVNVFEYPNQRGNLGISGGHGTLNEEDFAAGRTVAVFGPEWNITGVHTTQYPSNGVAPALTHVEDWDGVEGQNYYSMAPAASVNGELNPPNLEINTAQDAGTYTARIYSGFVDQDVQDCGYGNTMITDYSGLFAPAGEPRVVCYQDFTMVVTGIDGSFEVGADSVNATLGGSWSRATRTATAGDELQYRVHASNLSDSSINDAVMYDVLPSAGDKGTVQALLGSARGSNVTPKLTSISVDKLNGGTLAYSQAANPCRPEVAADNPGCEDDWSTAQPQDLSTVTAIRVTFPTLASGAVTNVTLGFEAPQMAAGAKIVNTVAGTGMQRFGAPPAVESRPVTFTAGVADMSVTAEVLDEETGTFRSEGSVAEGGTAHWRVTVANTGTTPLIDVDIDDARVQDCIASLGEIGRYASKTVECQSPNVREETVNVATAEAFDPNGLEVTASASATVRPVAQPVVVSPPIVVTNPVSTTVSVGKPVTLTAQGTNADSVRWQQSIDGVTWVDVADSGASYDGLTSSFDPATDSVGAVQYRAVFTNADGEAATEAATVSVFAVVDPGPGGSGGEGADGGSTPGDTAVQNLLAITGGPVLLGVGIAAALLILAGAGVYLLRRRERTQS